MTYLGSSHDLVIDLFIDLRLIRLNISYQLWANDNFYSGDSEKIIQAAGDQNNFETVPVLLTIKRYRSGATFYSFAHAPVKGKL